MSDIYLTLPARRLNDKDQCCGRKPLTYKRPLRRLCTRCCAQYDGDGRQEANWAWHRTNNGFVSVYPETHDYVRWSKAKCQ